MQLRVYQMYANAYLRLIGSFEYFECYFDNPTLEPWPPVLST